MGREKTTFEPTMHMLDYLEAMCQAETKQTITALAERAGISRQTVYDWYRVDGFSAWLMGEYAASRARHRPLAVNAMLKGALDGDVQAYKAWASTDDMLQYRPAGSVELTGRGGGPVEIIIPGLAAANDEDETA